jgi:MazG family protein
MPVRKTARHRLPSLGKRFEKLVAVQARLRAPGGCPWDREQTARTLRPFLLEEAYEVLEAIDLDDPKRLASELGDLLLQVVFHAQLASEKGGFDVGDVIDAIREKLIRRHPHVFAKARAKNAAEVLRRWEELKAEERSREGRPDRHSLLDGVPKGLPALSQAFQLTRRAANVGFDWKRLDGVLEKLEEETGELRRAAGRLGRKRVAPADSAGPASRRAGKRIEEEVGDLIFVAANIARFLGLDPEITLKKANRKFERRFRFMERQAARKGVRLAELAPQGLEQLWNQAKSRRPS